MNENVSSDLSRSEGTDAEGASEPDSCQRVAVALDADDADPPDSTWLTEKLEAALDELRLADAAVSLVIVNDARMTELHAQFSNDPTPTDVLTFDLSESDDGLIEGEIYICLDEARRRAADLGHAAAYEVLLYGLHGILHLMGYDDHDPEDHRVMHETEDRVLEAIGVGRVFSK